MKIISDRILVVIFKSELKGARFFTPLGVVAGLAMEITSLLPDRVNRDTFSSMINDHLPWTTISILFLTQLVAATSYPLLPNGNVKQYVRGLVFSFTSKLLQLCAPATFVIFGLSIASALIGVFTLSIEHFGYAAFFASASVFPIVLHRLSLCCITKLMRYRGETFRPLFKVLLFSISIVLIVTPLFNDSPMEVSFKLPLGNYYLIKEAADKLGKEISEYAREATIDSALPVTPEEGL